MQTSWAKAFASGQVSLLFLEAASGVTTCNPLPPVVLQKQTRPISSSRSRILLAASTTVENATLGPGSRSKMRRPGISGMLRLAVPGMQFERRHLRDSGETFHSIDLKIVGLSARTIGRIEPFRSNALKRQ